MKRTPIKATFIAGGLLLSSHLFGSFNVDIPMHDFTIIGEYDGYATCAACHESFAPSFAEHISDIMASSHWTWTKDDGFNDNEVGKINVINNFCVAVPSNEPRCTSCHIGIGWTDDSFDLGDRMNIDCFICHDGTKTYAKVPTAAGAPVDGLDYDAIIRSFQLPDRDNCGACHFNGGGGEGVKHGTMDGSLSMPTREIDVHMGIGFTCITCHRLDGKVSNTADFFGSRHSKDTTDEQLCVDCHINGWGPNPEDGHHEAGIFPDHFDVLSCQACHVPALARGGKPTKMFWDWSTAGDYIVPEGGGKQDRVIKDDNGWIIYHSKKGTFEWGVNVVPDYVFSNGKFDHVTIGDAPVNPNGITPINTFYGGPNDGKIFPVKRFMAIQPYDAGTNQLAVPNLFPGGTNGAEDKTAGNAYWAGYNWEKALSSGMAAVGIDWVGPVGWAESEYLWIADHMVAPAEQAVTCIECHNSFGRIDFAKLGLNTGLQRFMDNKVWAGYPLEDGPEFDTGDWLGVVTVTEETLPYVYVHDLGDYIYMPNEEVLRLRRLEGLVDWAGYSFDDGPYFDTGDWLGVVYLTKDTYPWVYVFDMGRYILMPNEAVLMDGNWGYFPY